MDSIVFAGLGIIVLGILSLFYPVFIKAKNNRLTGNLPRVAEKKATLVVNTSPHVFEHCDRVISPFVGQIEDILRSRLSADPTLRQYKIEFGESLDCGLEIWVNGKKYTGIKNLPDKSLKRAFCEAIKEWNLKQCLPKEQMDAKEKKNSITKPSLLIEN